jgi:hypothetical protein
MSICLSVESRAVLTNAAGVPLVYGKLRTEYGLCWYCQFSEPEAAVQGKRGAWYHLHPRGERRNLVFPIGEHHAALLAALSPIEYEGLFSYS